MLLWTAEPDTDLHVHMSPAIGKNLMGILKFFKILLLLLISSLAVLPKFEVKVKLPAYVIEKESQLHGAVDVK